MATSSTCVGEGTGLGLSVVQRIVRDHGGFVLVDNEPGEGARFDVHFPLAEQAPARVAAAQSVRVARRVRALEHHLDDAYAQLTKAIGRHREVMA